MAATAATAPGSAPPQTAQFLEDLEQARRGTLALVASLSEEDLERVHSPIMSPLVWDLGHIAAYEDLWLAHRYGGMPLLRPDLADCYDAFETPRAVRGDVEALGAEDARAYLQEVRARTCTVIRSAGVGDGVICEMVLRHELQHAETMRQTLAIAGLLPAGDEARAAEPLGPTGRQDEWAQIAAGPFALGASGEAFAYDNERPRHTAETPAFLIARHPVSSESWMRFAEDGGYERREWWSPEGWAWKVQNDIAPHPALAASHPLTAACHVSWYEADAFARARHARLPTEAEWEKAATQTAPGDARRRSRPGQTGALAGVGQVWEWTQTRFHGYPGFVAHPYREYSEVFFGDAYHVLRGGSWATHPRVRSLSFRNWDLPQRRQIFAGLRLATDA
jgi:gamma-glutamyl hercynylcysteine S-oxide synthase